MALESAKAGATIGQFFGPEGEVGGAVIGGVLGAAGIAANIIRSRNREPSSRHERQPLLVRPSPLQGRTLIPTSTIRQRNPAPVPGREGDFVDVPLNEPTTTRPSRPQNRPTVIRIRPSHIRPILGAATAAAATTTAAIASQIPNAAPTTTPPQPPTVVSPGAPHPPPVTPTVPTSPPIDEPPVIIDPNNPDLEIPPEQETKQPEIPPEVLFEHFTNEQQRNQRSGNYRLPVYGRHDFIEWTKFTEGNALKTQY